MDQEVFKNKYSLLKKIEKGIRIYNKYRSPEATAKLIEFDGENIKVLFKGSFCATCGIRDWVEDLKYIYQDVGLETDLVEYIEEGEDSRIGVFRIKGEDGGVDGERG